MGFAHSSLTFFWPVSVFLRQFGVVVCQFHMRYQFLYLYLIYQSLPLYAVFGNVFCDFTVLYYTFLCFYHGQFVERVKRPVPGRPGNIILY